VFMSCEECARALSSVLMGVTVRRMEIGRED
jgi:hypothetical protein